MTEPPSLETRLRNGATYIREFVRQFSDYPLEHWKEAAEILRSDADEAEEAAETIVSLHQQLAQRDKAIAEAMEACPAGRMQRFFGATLLELVNEEVSQLFRMQSRAEAAEARIATLEQAARFCYEEMRLQVSGRASFTDALDALDAALFPNGAATDQESGR
jgi:tRNA A37 N6-isopentenylltransferase MiaA